MVSPPPDRVRRQTGLMSELASCDQRGIRAARVERARRHLRDRSWDTAPMAGEIARRLLAASGPGPGRPGLH